MTIKIAFIVNRETFRIEIKDKTIWYSDRRWDKSIRLIPKDENFMKKILLSRNTIPMVIKEMFNLTKKEIIEYEQAKTENDLADICIKDCRLKGARLIKKEVIEEDVEEDIVEDTSKKQEEEKENGNI